MTLRIFPFDLKIIVSDRQSIQQFGSIPPFYCCFSCLCELIFCSKGISYGDGLSNFGERVGGFLLKFGLAVKVRVTVGVRQVVVMVRAESPRNKCEAM